MHCSIEADIVASLSAYGAVFWASWRLAALGYAFRFLQNCTTRYNTRSNGTTVRAKTGRWASIGRASTMPGKLADRASTPWNGSGSFRASTMPCGWIGVRPYTYLPCIFVAPLELPATRTDSNSFPVAAFIGIFLIGWMNLHYLNKLRNKRKEP